MGCEPQGEPAKNHAKTTHVSTPTTRETPGAFTLVIFGASGDLTRRKLVPAVYCLFRAGLLPEGFRLVGFARRPKSDEAFREELREGVAAFARVGLGPADAWEAFSSKLHYHQGDYAEPEGFRSLAKRLDAIAVATGSAGNRLFYLATPPTVFEPVVSQLREAGLARANSAEADGWARLIIEKPFGRDLTSARALNAHLQTAFAEDQIYRIDHYLGKETVQNLLVFRFANSLFEPIWNQKYVDHVQITVSETVGVEGRGSYYDHAGALRDMVQNHMMHLLCLVAMEPPVALGPNAVRDEKVKVLQALRPIPVDCVSEGVVRAQYAAGTCGDKAVPAYRDEQSVAPDSTTETFVAIKAFIDNWRWAGVPFYLRTGKALPARITEIGIHFKPVPQVLFNTPPYGPMTPNVLGLRIQPNEGISLQFQVKVPGPAGRIQPHKLDFGYAQTFGAEPPEAYERLLLDAALGDSTLFTRSDEVEAAWTFLMPILEGCADAAVRELPTYPAGSWGPKEADDLIEADGHNWALMRRPRSKAHGKGDGGQRASDRG